MSVQQPVISDRVASFLWECFQKHVSPAKYCSLAFLTYLAENPDEELRCMLAKSLAWDEDRKLIPVLSKLAADREPLVRVEAVDSLSSYCCEESYRILLRTVADNDPLVRAYSVWGLASVAGDTFREETVTLLNRLLESESEGRIQVDIYSALYILGERSALQCLLCLFDSSDYHTQCALLNTLPDIVNEENRRVLKSFLEDRLTSAHPLAVSLTLSKVYNLL